MKELYNLYYMLKLKNYEEINKDINYEEIDFN